MRGVLDGDGCAPVQIAAGVGKLVHELVALFKGLNPELQSTGEGSGGGKVGRYYTGKRESKVKYKVSCGKDN